MNVAGRRVAGENFLIQSERNAAGISSETN